MKVKGYIQLPVAYAPDDMSQELANDIDAYEEDILWVRPESIDAFNKDSKGRVTIRIDGGAWTVLMTLNDFVKLINEQL